MGGFRSRLRILDGQVVLDDLGPEDIEVGYRVGAGGLFLCLLSAWSAALGSEHTLR